MSKENTLPWDRTGLLQQENMGWGAAPQGTVSQQLKHSEDLESYLSLWLVVASNIK